MKTNTMYDNSFNSEKKSNSTGKIIIAALIATLLFSVTALCLFFFFHSDNSSEIEKNGKRYGNSEFYQYKGKIYVLIVGEGMAALDKADTSTFKALDSDDYGGNVGLDKNNVYFGNVIIPDLNPDSLYSVGNNYYSDGTNNYFCSTSSELEGNTYTYPYKKLDNGNKLKIIDDLNYIATDGEKIYYKGEHLTGADPETFGRIGETAYPSPYFTDGSNVYYKSTLLSIKNNGHLKAVRDSYQNISYLYDELNGTVFAEDYFFDALHAPYQIIGADGTHSYNLFFISKDGTYFFNPEKEEQERIGDNIFKGNIEEISPNIFSDDENIYYLDAYEIRAEYQPPITLNKTIPKGRLISLNSGIYYLDKKAGWEKVTDLGGANLGMVWKKGANYYYFDNAGIFQLIFCPIYEISDKETLDYITASSKSDQIYFEDEIKKLINGQKLTAVTGEEKMSAVIKYIENPNEISPVKAAVLIAGLMLGIYIKFFKKKRQH